MGKKRTNTNILGFDKPIRANGLASGNPVELVNGSPEPPIGDTELGGLIVEQPTTTEPGPVIIDPIELDLNGDTGNGSGDSQPTTPGRRGRPPGSRNLGATGESRLKKASNLIADLESLLLSVHFMGARLLSIPELELDPSEAAKLSEALKNVAKHYSVNIDPKKLALFELGTTVTAIYGPRVIAVIKSPKQPSAAGPQLVPPIKKDTEPAKTPAQKPWNELTPSELMSDPPTDSYSM